MDKMAQEVLVAVQKLDYIYKALKFKRSVI